MNKIEPYKKAKFEERKKSVHQYDLDGNLIETFESIQQASKLTKVAAPSICLCCQGKRLSAGKFMWRYV